ncbi:MAG: hypothetical protein R3Y46_02730 [Opitutales bacterium]
MNNSEIEDIINFIEDSSPEKIGGLIELIYFKNKGGFPAKAFALIFEKFHYKPSVIRKFIIENFDENFKIEVGILINELDKTVDNLELVLDAIYAEKAGFNIEDFDILSYVFGLSAYQIYIMIKRAIAPDFEISFYKEHSNLGLEAMKFLQRDALFEWFINPTKVETKFNTNLTQDFIRLIQRIEPISEQIDFYKLYSFNLAKAKDRQAHQNFQKMLSAKMLKLKSIESFSKDVSVVVNEAIGLAQNKKIVSYILKVSSKN